MTIAFRTADNLAAHAVCAAAGLRDSLRAAQFYVRDLAHADGQTAGQQTSATFLSRSVAGLARLADRFMTWGANTSIRLILPSWRKLPSPFTPGLMDEVSSAVRENSLLHNPLFNSYFFRAAIHIVEHYSKPPYLVLEHRVDAARRQLAQDAQPKQSETEFLARVLLALSEAHLIAKTGPSRLGRRLFETVDPNVAVPAIACVSLLFAGEGQPIEQLDDDQFFAIVGALILPRLETLAALIDTRDTQAIAQELAAIKAIY
ncbi:hypothetical protein [Aestuariivirga sp.]|uniref:hypothetical protein n=1 Tax=Aestuariivirga sp. TaxID=2650926 RepID=UPI0039E62053